MIGHWDYLGLMAACLLITLPLELVFAARVYRRWQILLTALFPVVVVFAVWDVFAIARDHWTYNPRFVTGIDLGVLPLEELVFFLVIPVCALLSYEAVGTVIGWVRRLAGGGTKTEPRTEVAGPTKTEQRSTESDHRPPNDGEAP